MMYSWPTNEGKHALAIVVCVRPDVNVNIETGQPVINPHSSLCRDATYDLHPRGLEWSNLTCIDVRDAAFIDIE